MVFTYLYTNMLGIFYNMAYKTFFALLLPYFLAFQQLVCREQGVLCMRKYGKCNMIKPLLG